MRDPRLTALDDVMRYGVVVPRRIGLADLEAAKRTSAFARARRLMEVAHDADAFSAALGGDHEAAL